MSNGNGHGNSGIPINEIPYLLRPAPSAQGKRFEPAHDVVVFRVEEARRTAAGLVMPDTVEDAKRQIVVAVGPGGILQDGTRVPVCCKPGDQIITAPGQRFPGNNLLGEILYFCRDGDVVARVVDAEDPA